MERVFLRCVRDHLTSRLAGEQPDMVPPSRAAKPAKGFPRHPHRDGKASGPNGHPQRGLRPRPPQPGAPASPENPCPATGHLASWPAANTTAPPPINQPWPGNEPQHDDAAAMAGGSHPPAGQTRRHRNPRSPASSARSTSATRGANTDQRPGTHSLPDARPAGYCVTPADGGAGTRSRSFSSGSPPGLARPSALT